MARKGISNKIRFEVFKRDSFSCQYCGKKAPDVILEVDHIHPVAKGGKNSILNYITACFECNSGKSDRLLSDQTLVEKQRQQLAELQERREQIEMMLQWHEGIKEVKDIQSEKFLEYFNSTIGCNISLSTVGQASLKKLIKQFGFSQLLAAVDIVHEKYQDLDVEQKFKKLGGILAFMNADENDRNAMYIKGICKNRFSYFDHVEGMKLIKDAIAGGYEFNYLKGIAIDCRNWTQWRMQMEGLFE